MTLFEDIGQELTNLAFALISAIIIYCAWRSTNVRDERLPPTAVLIIENNRRRLLDTVGRGSINFVHSPSTESNYSNTTEEVELDTERTPTPIEDIQISEAPSLQDLIDEVTDLATSTNTSRTSVSNRAIESVEEQINDLLDTDTDIGPQRIIEDMDSPDTAEGLRRRRIAFYDNDSNNRQQENSDGTTNSNQNHENREPQPQQQERSPRIRRENLNIQTENDIDSSHAENCSNENNENESKSKTEIVKTILVNDTEPTLIHAETKDDEFRIKLKYLNDELRLVKGSPNEAIGDFKKRNFTVEISAQKLVRLVFNGHVLQPDTKTLQACGLFDNCVVHCLIHNKKPSAPNYGGENRTNQNQDQPEAAHTGLGTNTFSERSGNGPLFVYLGMIFVSLAIIFCWYCRIQYSYLFSWYSTSGLVLMTVLYLVMFPLIILIEREVTN